MATIGKNIDPTVIHDTLDDPPQFPGDSSRDPFRIGTLAANIPNAIVKGEIYARVSQNPSPDPIHFTDDDAPASTSVNVNQPFVIDVYWGLSGPLVSAFSGSWDLTIFFDCASDSALDFQIKPTNSIPYGCPDPTSSPLTTTNTRQYHASFLAPANTVSLDPNSPTATFYELDVSIVLLNSCNSLPTTGIVGSVSLEEVSFFSV